MTFEEQLKNYAELLVRHGLNVQAGQVVNIATEVCNRDFGILVAEAAYEAGAKYVNLDLSDPRVGKMRIDKSKEEDLDYVPAYLSVKYEDLVKDAAANMRILGSEAPDILADSDPKRINRVRIGQRKALEYFYDEGIGKSKVHWTLGSASTKEWAVKIFPELEPEKAKQKLWESILKVCRADKENCLELWKEHNSKLHARAKALSDLKIKEIHFTGPGTDLVVALSRASIFKGGTDGGPLGVPFEPNIPTEEVFTTPDWRGTTGEVTTTRPFYINGNLIKDLYLEFNEGEISHFTASQGEETFKEYINSDPGAKRLGEVALVGTDSPIYQSGLVFQEILFDENAACHIAIGMAYKFCLDGGSTMSKEELEAIGCNDSTVHTDMMISDERVDATARCFDGSEKQLIKAGKWVI